MESIGRACCKEKVKRTVVSEPLKKSQQINKETEAKTNKRIQKITTIITTDKKNTNSQEQIEVGATRDQ